MKHITLLSFLILDTFIVCSQPCTPNTGTIPGIEPDTLAVAWVGSPYNEALYYYMPEDTFVLFGTVLVHLYIDSLTIDSVQGLPPGFNYACNNAWCSVHGGGNGCAAITGTAATADTGIYPLMVYVKVAVSDTFGTPVAQVPDTVTTYFITVQMPNGMEDVLNESFFVGNVYPNPADDIAYMDLNNTGSGALTIEVFNSIGRVMAVSDFNVRKGENVYPADVSHLPSGIYYVMVRKQNEVLKGKLIVAH